MATRTTECELVSSASGCCLLPYAHPLPFIDTSFFCFNFIRYTRAPLFCFQERLLLGVTQLYWCSCLISFYITLIVSLLISMFAFEWLLVLMVVIMVSMFVHLSPVVTCEVWYCCPMGCELGHIRGTLVGNGYCSQAVVHSQYMPATGSLILLSSKVSDSNKMSRISRALVGASGAICWKPYSLTIPSSFLVVDDGSSRCTARVRYWRILSSLSQMLR